MVCSCIKLDMTNKTKVYGVLNNGDRIEIAAASRMAEKKGLDAALAMCERLNTEKRGGYFGEFVKFETQQKG